MARKKKSAPVVETPVVHPDPIDIPTEVAADAVIDAKVDVIAAPTYSLAGSDRPRAKRGFESALLAELERGGGSAAELVDRLIASGEYAKIAPKAAELRPLKPVKYILKIWAQSHYLTAVTPIAEELVAAE